MTKSERWDWKGASKKAWYTEGQPDPPYDYAAIGVACLQRIADSLEVLVDLSDPRLLEQRAAEEAREKERMACWDLFMPFIERVNDAQRRAMTRLFAGKIANNTTKRHVACVYSKDSPDQPYTYLDGPVQLDTDKCERWCKESEDYWDGLTELPLVVAGKDTKKQARYAEWLSSLNGNGVVKC
jgi:hypothetical protein